MMIETFLILSVMFVPFSLLNSRFSEVPQTQPSGFFMPEILAAFLAGPPGNSS